MEMGSEEIAERLAAAEAELARMQAAKETPPSAVPPEFTPEQRRDIKINTLKSLIAERQSTWKHYDSSSQTPFGVKRKAEIGREIQQYQEELQGLLREGNGSLPPSAAPISSGAPPVNTPPPTIKTGR
jgi:ribosomal protein L29